MNETAAFEHLRSVTEFAGLDREDVKITRLGGLTNIVFRVQTADRDLLLRIPGQGTESYIDRKVEAHNARVAADAGISPEVIHFDVESGLMISQYVDAPTMSPERFRTTPGAPTRAAAVFRQLHQSGKTFEFRFELFAMIDDYLRILNEKNAKLPEGYNDVVAEAGAVREALNAHPAALAPCHCDPLCENFLDTGTRMWVVDWEYSGMNDPLWDLGDLSVEAGFGPEEDRELMEAYVGGKVDAATYGRMVIYKAMCDLLWTLWGLIQHADGNPAEDFWAYATERFARCRTLMATPDFARHLAAVKAGSA
ncbi:choline/ethanolamine kinase family protein [Acuticoccus sp. MNP-M23]|uniref:choline/ethanolamine kinase family protein n=1 Tax=Acuticoccus sp. MNP-M23 TaxID=3072793 RepID=UPI002816505F|nr:choline/ethanolamine kinase family protein [Acuticoccus sp. MNP-M23]WMS44601.1 choline/ethanolamine kinase family protein [Acuticoccus sp. MNP-M23]